MESTDETDALLVERLSKGDARALETLYDRHSAAVTRYAWALAADRLDVEEVLQDTFVTLWRCADRIRVIKASALPWLLVTCRNHARNLARRRALHKTSELPDELSWTDDSEAGEQLRWVMDAISQLDPIDQQVCRLCLIEGRPYKEAAAVLGTSIGAIKQRVARNRARLRKAVVDNEG